MVGHVGFCPLKELFVQRDLIQQRAWSFLSLYRKRVQPCSPVQKRQWWKSKTIGKRGLSTSCSVSRSRTLNMLARSSFSTVTRAYRSAINELDTQRSRSASGSRTVNMPARSTISVVTRAWEKVVNASAEDARVYHPGIHVRDAIMSEMHSLSAHLGIGRQPSEVGRKAP